MPISTRPSGPAAIRFRSEALSDSSPPLTLGMYSRIDLRAIYPIQSGGVMNVVRSAIRTIITTRAGDSTPIESDIQHDQLDLASRIHQDSSLPPPHTLGSKKKQSSHIKTSVRARPAKPNSMQEFLHGLTNWVCVSQVQKPSERNSAVNQTQRSPSRIGNNQSIRKPAHLGRSCRSCHATPSSLAWRFARHHSIPPVECASRKRCTARQAGTSSHSARTSLNLQRNREDY